MIGKRLCGLPTIGEAPFSNALLFIGVFLDCSFVSFLKDSSKGIKTDTYYIDKQKLPYLYKFINIWNYFLIFLEDYTNNCGSCVSCNRCSDLISTCWFIACKYRHSLLHLVSQVGIIAINNQVRSALFHL